MIIFTAEEMHLAGFKYIFVRKSFKKYVLCCEDFPTNNNYYICRNEQPGNKD